MKIKQKGGSKNKLNKQREKTEQGTGITVWKNGRMGKEESRKEHRKEQKDKIRTDFWIPE